MVTLFEKEYDGSSLCDIQRDVYEMLDERFNPNAKHLIKDEYGNIEGRVIITVDYMKD